MIYTLESPDTLVKELLPLMQMVWNEVDQRKEGGFELDIDVELYLQLIELGVYKPYSIRTDEGKLVGYIGVSITPSLHCKGRKDASTDVMYVHPKYRGCGSKLLKLIVEDLKEEGVTWFSFVTKAWLDEGGLAEELDFKLYETVYQKRL